MKSRLSRSILFILVLTLALQAFALPAFAQSETNESQAEIVERPEYIPPTAEVIAETQAQVNAFNCSTVTDVPKIECEALVALYQSTNGAGWKNNSNWLKSTKVSTWSGVFVKVGRGVTELMLFENQLTGILPVVLGNLSNLETLLLQSNQLTGNIPAEFGNLSNLAKLALFNNQLTGSIPIEFGNLSNMMYLWLYDNQLTGGIPTSLGNLSKLWELNLGANQLTGGIPAVLGNLTNLHFLNLAFNQLTGSIPSSLGSLSNLEGLYLYKNQLTGSIPSSLGNLSKLMYLYLYGNQLTGSIPPELGNLSNIMWMHLNNNQLTGSIPPTLGKLSTMDQLYLNNNRLTGSIPSELGQLTNFRYLNLSGNAFEGEIPNTFPKLVNLCERLDRSKDCWFPEIGLDLGYNQLNVPQTEPVASFLKLKDPDWHLTQAIKVTIPGESGGIIQSRDGMTKIEIPAGAYTGELTFHLIPHFSPKHPLRGLMEANHSFELITTEKGEEINSFALPLKATIKYTDQQIGPILEDRLNLYQWKSSQSGWKDAISACPGGEYVRKPRENWLSLPICELGEFALLGETLNLYLPLVRR